ncbi:cyanosortase-associated family protein [Lyngbya aestuarii BL J]|uniref:Cyanosortase-associated family protein n=2 Tax=Lyngbya aestuarii TaxID=118322 RepID=U7QJL8_9CYAN|nr:cyanosortase-associated family protein [Lyngbya aestuarii BL J]
MMKFWHQLRTPLLAFTGSFVILVLARVVFASSTQTLSKTTINLPEKVPLSEWNSTSYTLEKPEEESLFKTPDQRYQYIQNDLTLNIEMRYLPGGNVERLVEKYQLSPSFPLVRQQENLGFYGLFVAEKRAYLSACINPKGISTFTRKQYSQNHSIYTLEWNRFIPWFLGQKQLRQRGCLWANLSIPLEDNSPEAAYQVLEKAWFSWYTWWSANFPSLN